MDSLPPAIKSVASKSEVTAIWSNLLFERQARGCATIICSVLQVSEGRTLMRAPIRGVSVRAESIECEAMMLMQRAAASDSMVLSPSQ